MPLDSALNLLALVLSGAMAAMLAGVLLWFASPTNHAHYRHWVASWLAQSVYYLVGGVSFFLGTTGQVALPLRVTLSVTTQVANAIGACLLVAGAIGYVNRRVIDRRRLAQTLLIAVIAGTAVAMIGLFTEWRSVRPLFRAAVSSASLITCGVIIMRHRAALDRPGRFLSYAMLGFGLAHVHYFIYAGLGALGVRPSYSLSYVTLLDIGWITAIATTMVALAFADQQEEGAAVLHRREAEFRQMIEKSNDIIAVLDANLVVRYSSPSTTRVLGWGDDLIGRPITAYVHPEDQRAVEARAIEAVGLVGSTMRLRLRGRDGNWVHLEAVATRTVDESNDTIYIINARDLAERDRLEGLLRESQKLESVGRLAGGVAHDLNNILAVIGGNAELGLVDATGPVHESLQHISGASTRAAGLIRQLLTFARRQVVATRVFDLWEAVNATTGMAARLLPETIDFRIHPPAYAHPITADPGQIEQVVMNLIVNARDAIVGSGAIDVEVGDVLVASSPEPGVPAGRYATVSVRDTGAGMSEFVRKHLFEPFFTTKALGEGTGLGLATSYGIVKQAGGFITVESEMGSGSTFCVHLPSADIAPSTPHAPDTPQSLAHAERVLVVEDDQAVRAVTTANLRRFGYDVFEAANGIDALALVEISEPFDVLVTDIVMPRMGGVELAHAMRERQRDIGVVLVSGYPGDPDFLGTLSSGTTFLQKPFDAAELVERVQEALARRGRIG